MDHAQKVRTCVHCGREYVSENYRTNVCSEECRRERIRAMYRARTATRGSTCRICGKPVGKDKCLCPECKPKHSNVADPVRAYAPVSLHVLRYAKKQPRGVSDARWRMELSRRKLERNCPDAYHMLPDPDRLS